MKRSAMGIKLAAMLVAPALTLALNVTPTCGQGTRASEAGFRPDAAGTSTLNEQQQRQHLEDAHAAAEQTQSVDDCTNVLRTLRQLQRRQLHPEHEQYLLELMAWTFNRRGEVVAKQAGKVLQQGDENEAAQLERQALNDFSSALKANDYWRAYHNRGVSRAMLGEYDEAIEDFASAIQRNPKYVHSRYNRAELYLELGRYEDAQQDYDAVLQIDPKDVPALMGRGHTKFYLEKFDEAVADFGQVIQLQPENAVAYADRADLYAYLGQWEQAAADYKIALKLDNSLGRAFQSAAWLMATCPEKRFRDEKLAVRSARRAIQLDGEDDFRYLDTLAAAQANANLFTDAQKSLRRAIEQAPADVVNELQQRLALYQANRPFRDQKR